MVREKDKDFRQLGLLILVVVAGLGLSFSATRESVRSSEQQATSDFRASAELYVDRLHGQMLAGLTAAQDIYDYYREIDSVSPETFSLLTKTNSNMNKHRKFVSLAYALAQEDKAGFIAGMRTLYGDSYDVRNPAIVDVPEGAGHQFPLLYVWAEEQAQANALLGLNIGANKQMNGFLEAAMRTQTPSAVFIPPFPELDEGRTGLMLMANPFVSKGGNMGLIVQLVDFQGLITSIVEDTEAWRSSLKLNASSHWGDAEQTVSFGQGEPDTVLTVLSPYQEEFTLGAGTWTIIVSAVPGAFPVDYGPAVITASVCLLLTSLFFFIVWSQLRRAKRVADIVSRRTRALKEAHDELEEHYKLLQNLNKDVEEARRSAELANRAKSEFLATMSHELRTPLNAILGFSQLLGEQALGPIGDDRYIEYSNDIHSSGSHLLSLINDILDLAKLEAGKVHIEKNSISTRLLTERVVTLLSQQAESKGIELYAEFDDNMPDMILGDELRLRQILINLSSNAIKFTHEGAVVARLFAKPFQNGRLGWVLEVQDTGIGIPEEKQATLFDRFTQVDAALSRRHGGVGLGLAICRELVDRMEGRISVRSIVNVGTTIRVHLPLEQASKDDLENDMII